MKITIYGSGYVGLVTGTCLAQVGNQVLCIDVDAAKVAGLNQGQIPIHEPGLSALVTSNLQSGRLRFSVDAKEGVAFSNIYLIAVGTPPDQDGSADLHHVLDVARDIAQHLQGPALVVNKSTVPVGTADRVRETLQAVLNERGVNFEFDVVSNPEFLKEGDAINDFMKPERIIVGTSNPRSLDILQELYAPFNRNRNRLIAMDLRSAELTKYAANAMLATKISFMNELANLAEHLGADIEQVRIGIGSDPRIGYHFIYPGCGYGGSCFPKDVKALHYTATQVGFDAPLLRAVEQVNHRQKQRVFDKIQHYFLGKLTGKTIALWGLAFKPNTDDMREAASRTLMEALWAAGARVQAYDPVAREEAQRLYTHEPKLKLCTSAYEALEGADVLAIVTEWTEFRSPDFARIKSLLKSPAIFDGRNLFDPELLQSLGFHYSAIGRGRS